MALLITRSVGTSRPGKPGLTSFCETLGCTFLHPISLISENEATEQIKWSQGLQVFCSHPFFHLFSLISENEAKGQIKWSQCLPAKTGWLRPWLLWQRNKIIWRFDKWSRARGPCGYLRTWNWPITAREISQPCNNSYNIWGWNSQTI